ncbi:MAG: hypothetical protein QM704_05270 [Anaeromyxobacteraceae bacterium]
MAGPNRADGPDAGHVALPVQLPEVISQTSQNSVPLPFDSAEEQRPTR